MSLKKCLLLLLTVLSLSASPKEPDVLFSYYLNNRTSSGLILDRESNRDTVSIAATGLSLFATAIATKKHDYDYNQAVSDFHQILNTVKNTREKRNRGWLYHFTNKDGVPKPYSEVSTIDSILFYASAKEGAKLLENKELVEEVNQLVSEIDYKWMMASNGKFYHGFYWFDNKLTLIRNTWDSLSEGILIYKFFNIPFTPEIVTYNLPLFTYYFVIPFDKDPTLVDNLRKAVQHQKDTFGYYGITATDTEHNGYQAFTPNVISPLAILSISRYIDGAKDDLRKLGVAQEICAFDVKTNWVSKDRIGIDVLVAYILINQEEK